MADGERGESQGNVETVLGGYEAFNRGDVEWIIAHVDPDIEWHDAPEVPGGTVHRGAEQVRVFLASFPRFWEELRFEPQRILASGDVVVSMVELTGRGRSSGAEVDAELAHLFELRGGRAVRAVTYFDRDEAMRAGGVSEGAAEAAWASGRQ